MSTLISILVSVDALAALASTIHVLLFYRRPTAAVAWMFAVWVLPLLGSFAYLTFAVYEGPRKVRRRRRAAARLRIARHDGASPRSLYADLADGEVMAKVVDSVTSFPLMAGNDLQVFADVEEAFDAQLTAMRAAEREILLQTYICADGRLQRELWDVLIERAEAGVKVCALFDPIGSYWLSSRRLAELRRAGCEAMTFLSPNPLQGRFQVNFRNHRKQLVIDRCQAFVGSGNWSDEYRYEDRRRGHPYRDLVLSVRGPAVPALGRVYLEDRQVAHGSDAEPDDGFEPQERDGEHVVRVVPSGPDEPSSSLPEVLGVALRSAARSILVVTPYFTPGGTMMHHLRVAALGGLRVRVLLPQRSDIRSADLAARRSFQQLLDAGVEIWLRKGRFLHAKAVVVDDRWSLIGSANFDVRSFFLNYELSLEVVGESFARSIEAFFATDFAEAEPLDADEFRRRGWWRRVGENAAALFEPIL